MSDDEKNSADGSDVPKADKRVAELEEQLTKLQKDAQQTIAALQVTIRTMAKVL